MENHGKPSEPFWVPAVNSPEWIEDDLFGLNKPAIKKINVWKPGAGAWSLEMAFIYLGASRR